MCGCEAAEPAPTETTTVTTAVATTSETSETTTEATTTETSETTTGQTEYVETGVNEKDTSDIVIKDGTGYLYSGSSLETSWVSSGENAVIFVRYEGNSKATLSMYGKYYGGWEKILECRAYVGKNGIGKEKKGDKKTPAGVYQVGEAFGIKDDPGSGVPYTKVTEYHYWSSAHDETYNKLIDVRDLGVSKIKGEHLIEYTNSYAYALDVGYNTELVYEKGESIFLHCFGKRKYTAGCIAVAEENMVTILQNITCDTLFCVYE